MARRRYKRKNDPVGFLGIIGLAILVLGYLKGKFYLFEFNTLKLKQLAIVSIMIFLVVTITIVFFSYLRRQKKKKAYLNSGILMVDKMDGVEFENFLLAHFEAIGYKVKLTKASNDYGTDLLLKNKHELIAVQAKRYSGKVGIKAVQEIVGSLNVYGAAKGMVVTNSYFTSNAIRLAKSNNIVLWDRNNLVEVMKVNGLKDVAGSVLEQTKETGKCPKCGGDLSVKNGRFGMFYGCSNYPKCDFTRNM